MVGGDESWRPLSFDTLRLDWVDDEDRSVDEELGVVVVAVERCEEADDTVVGFRGGVLKEDPPLVGGGVDWEFDALSRAVREVTFVAPRFRLPSVVPVALVFLRFAHFDCLPGWDFEEDLDVEALEVFIVKEHNLEIMSISYENNVHHFDYAFVSPRTRTRWNNKVHRQKFLMDTIDSR